ncbi:repeat-containing protein [Candidatus Magnetobacterium bavaricum]|uniref:Repeat-containing protein n=1 Tax=Candidatus Magnetobacterium bavaricum TaxID=29290 RepID=A0A0F3GVA4_9BACT|nr:repeat-containing protein [Candidatus Magnetobacterium bavaricum]
MLLSWGFVFINPTYVTLKYICVAASLRHEHEGINTKRGRLGMSEVTMLHVSDLHMEAACLKDIKIVLDALFADLKLLREQYMLTPDLVLFTGDFVSSGSIYSEFELARQHFVTPLMQSLNLSEDVFFFTPGNHDIDKLKWDEVVVNGIRATYTNTKTLNEFFDNNLYQSDPNKTRYFKTLHNFKLFKGNFNNSHQIEPRDLFSIYQLTVDGVKLGITCLNSVWLASGGENDIDRGNLLVCERQVDSALEKINDCDVKIALMHHPLDWLVDFDRIDVENSFRRRSALLFTGHLREPKPKITQNAIGELFNIEGGTLFKGNRKTKYQGYTIIRMEQDKIGVYLRKYIDDGRRFDKDVDRAPDGYLWFPRTSKKPSQSTKKDALQPPDVDAHITSMLDDIQSRLNVPMYIPLTCSHDILIRDSETDLEGEVDKFLCGNTQSGVLLILGDSGSGKSTFCARLFARLRKAYPGGGRAPLPVFIKLGPLYDSVKTGAFVDDELRRYEFDQSEIDRLKQGKGVIFFLDGYNELSEKVWLFEKDWLNGWTNAKVIITCRSQHLSKSDEFLLFRRVDQVTNRPDNEGFRSLYITPFSEKQIDSYLQAFVQTLVTNEKQWKNSDTYKKLILEIYNLKELSSNPLLLNIIVKTLPSLIKNDKVDSINRNGIYSEFIRQWFEKERVRLKSTEDHFFEFAEVLAFEMFIEGKIQTELPEKSLFGKKKAQESLLYKLLTSEDDNYAKFRSGCPIQRVKDGTFTFMHKSYQEYFAARWIKRAISEGSEDAIDALNRRLLTGESAIIAFLSEMVGDNGALLNILKESKTNSAIETAASNAATILNARRFCFSGHDLSGVRIPGADLSCVVLDRMDLSKADLRDVSFRKAFLRDTNLTGSRMEGVEFGEMPYLQGHSKDINSVAISPDGTKIVSGSADKTLRIWDMTTGNLINIPQGHSSSVNSLAVSLQGINQAACIHIPYSQGVIITTTNNFHTVRADCYAVNLTVMSLQSINQIAGGHIPYP